MFLLQNFRHHFLEFSKVKEHQLDDAEESLENLLKYEWLTYDSNYTKERKKEKESQQALYKLVE